MNKILNRVTYLQVLLKLPVTVCSLAGWLQLPPHQQSTFFFFVPQRINLTSRPHEKKQSSSLSIQVRSQARH